MDWSQANGLRMDSWSYRRYDEEGNFTDDDLLNDKWSRTQNFSPIWFRKPSWEVAIKATSIVPIMLIGILGNLAVIFLILSLKSLRKSHINLFIMNMAIADLLTSMYLISFCFELAHQFVYLIRFCPWLSLVDNIYQSYEMGPVFCKFSAFLKMLCLLAGVLSLIVISVDRFIAFVFPFKKHLNRKVSFVIIAAIWALAIILSSPLAIWRVYHKRQWLNYVEKWCGEEHNDTTKFYWIFLMIPLIYIPLFVMIGVYYYIIRNMDRLEKNIALNETPARLKHSRIVIKMLFIYIITTVICWAPLQVTVYYRYQKPKAMVNPYWYEQICFISHLFASANSAINPIVTFRKTFAHLVPKLFKQKKGSNRVMPLDVMIIQQQMDLAHPSLASDSVQKKIRLANISNSLQSHTTSFTKHIMMKRAPEIFMRDET